MAGFGTKRGAPAPQAGQQQPAMPQPKAAGAPAPPPGGAQTPGAGMGTAEKPGQRKATPQQEQQYSALYSAAVAMLYSEKFKAKAIKMLKSDGDPVDLMARLGAPIFSRVVTEMAKRGAELEAVAVIEAGRTFIEEIGDLAKTVGTEVSDEDIENAFYIAADTVRETAVAAGLLTQQELQSAARTALKTVNQTELKAKGQQIDAAKHRIKTRFEKGSGK